MSRLIVRRVFAGALTLALVAGVVFLAVEALPGDACTASLGRHAQGQRLANCRAELGLERPTLVRLAEWSGAAIRGDLGVSRQRERPVVEIIGPRLRNTLFLGAIAAAVSVPLAILLGVLAALHRDRRLDSILSVSSILAMTVPEFVSATMLVLVFSIGLGWLPGIVITPAHAPLRELWTSIVLPVLALALVATAHIQRMVRSSVSDVLTSDFALMASLRGVPPHRVLLRHVLPNALLPALHLVAMTVAWLLSGAVVIEVVFNYPGIGRLMVNAVADRDVPLVQGIALLLASIQLLANLGADLLSLVLNPRLRSRRD